MRTLLDMLDYVCGIHNQTATLKLRIDIDRIDSNSNFTLI